MASVPIPIVGPTYTNRSLSVSAQVTKNYYIEINQEGGEPVSLMPFPGTTLFATAGTGKNRGSGKFNDLYYTISGSELYSVSESGVEILIGTIPGTDQCVLESDGNLLVIAYGAGKPITWDGAIFTTGTDIDLPNASTVSYINRRVVYDGNNQDVVFANLDDPLTVSSSNVTSADGTPDDTIAVLAKLSQLFVFGDDTTTPFYNSGVGNPPYDVIQNSIQDMGLKAIHSLASNKDFIYFLGDDLNVYRINGLQAQAIGNPAIGQAISGYTNPQNAIGLTFTLQNQNFYYLTFPSEETWLYNENIGWTTLSFGVNGESHVINSYQNIYNKHIVTDRRNGKIYELDFEKFTDNGDVIQRQRDTVSISGRTFGKPGARVYMDKLELFLETGTSLITGQGSDAQIMMQYSDDNGRSFSSERWVSVGAQGEYGTKVEWFGLGFFYNRMFRFKMSDPIKWTIISLWADLELEIG